MCILPPTLTLADSLTTWREGDVKDDFFYRTCLEITNAWRAGAKLPPLKTVCPQCREAYDSDLRHECPEADEGWTNDDKHNDPRTGQADEINRKR